MQQDLPEFKEFRELQVRKVIRGIQEQRVQLDLPEFKESKELQALRVQSVEREMWDQPGLRVILGLQVQQVLKLRQDLRVHKVLQVLLG